MSFFPCHTFQHFIFKLDLFDLFQFPTWGVLKDRSKILQTTQDINKEQKTSLQEEGWDHQFVIILDTILPFCIQFWFSRIFFPLLYEQYSSFQNI